MILLACIFVKLQIRNVRKFESAEIEIKSGQRIVFVGTNNSGKSSLLEFVAKCLWSLPVAYDYRGQEPDRVNLTSTFYRRTAGKVLRPTASLRIEAYEWLGKDEVVFAHDGFVDVELTATHAPRVIETDKPITAFLAPTTIKFSDGKNALDLVRVQPGEIDSRASLDSSGVFQIHGRIHSEEGWTPLTGTGPASGYVNGPTLHQLQNLQNPFSRLIRKFSDRVFYFSASRDPLFHASREHKSLSQKEIRSVTPYLQRLSFDDTKKRALEASIGTVFEEVKKLALISSGDGLVPGAVLEAGEEVPIADMGFGLRNVVQILTAILAAPPNSLFLIDEPEQGLNQSRQRDFAFLLETLRTDVTVMIATQSEAFCKGLEKSTLQLVEIDKGKSSIARVDIKNSHDDRRRLAKVMGINPLFLIEGGKILFVEGASDRKIIEKWLALNLGSTLLSNVQVQDLGGCGKIGEEFAKPMFKQFRDNLFFLLDSDRANSTERYGKNIKQLVGWFDEEEIKNYYVLEKREMENYLGHEAMAAALGINHGKIKPVAGTENFCDHKAVVKAEQGFYDESKTAWNAFETFPENKQKDIFASENGALLGLIRKFLET